MSDPEQISWIAITAKVVADIEDQLRAAGLTFTKAAHSSTRTQFDLTQDRGECTVWVGTQFVTHRTHECGVYIKVLAPARCNVRSVLWKRNRLPINFPYGKIVKRAVDILRDSHVQSLAYEQDRLQRDANRRDVIQLLGGLVTPEERDGLFRGLPVRKVGGAYILSEQRDLTAKQVLSIMQIIRGKGTKRQVFMEPDELRRDEPEDCSECQKPTRTWLTPHIPLCEECAKGSYDDGTKETTPTGDGIGSPAAV